MTEEYVKAVSFLYDISQIHAKEFVIAYSLKMFCGLDWDSAVKIACDWVVKEVDWKLVDGTIVWDE